ncbi:MAG: ATP-binding protein [Gallionella sp.]
MNFRLTRLILIDSYCRNRIAELDISGHITINGENGAGKTTLLRLLPMFLGESPSRIIRGDAVMEKFSRYYFPSTASYVIFEYQRRNQKALAVIHPDGQSDGVVYRFIDSEYKPELFKDGNSLVQTGNLYRHLDKMGVYDSKPLTLHAYRQIIQNTAGREHKNLAGRFSFTGGTGKLTHMERIVTGILQRATTFHDLKRMIVSSILDNDEGFSLRTGKKDLLHWVSEYEAHHALMEKTPVMADLEQSDQHRRMAEIYFSKLHARFKLLHDHFEQQALLAEQAVIAAKSDISDTEKVYEKRLREVVDKKTLAASNAKQAKDNIDQLDRRKSQYKKDEADAKSAKLDSVPSLRTQLEPLEKHLNDLEKEFKSVTEVFDRMAVEATSYSKDEKSKLETARGDVYKATSKRKDELAELYQANTKTVRSRHESELGAISTKASELRTEEAKLAAEARNALPDPDIQAALDAERQVQTAASDNLENLRNGTDILQKAHQNIKGAFNDFDLQVSSGDVAIEKIQEELGKLLAADNAGEDTLLGFLRRNKHDWAANIGRLVSEETLLRTDLSPVVGDGDNFYGIGIELDRLKAGRFTSEEILQQEIKLARNRLESRIGEVEEDKKSLADTKAKLDKAKKSLAEHEAAIAVAKNAKSTADQNVLGAEKRLIESKRMAIARAEEKLKVCRTNLEQAERSVEATKKDHEEELSQAENVHKKLLRQVKTDEETELARIETKREFIDAELAGKLGQISKNRDECLQNKGVSTVVLAGIRTQISGLNTRIDEAESFRPYVSQYRDWLENIWSQKAVKQQEWQAADAEENRCKRENEDLLKERYAVFQQKQKVIDEAKQLADSCATTQRGAKHHLLGLSHWPIDNDTLSAGFESGVGIETLAAERKRLQNILDECHEKIRLGVENIRRQMCSSVGTGPEKFYTTSLQALGHPRPGKEYEWLEVFRNWFNNEHATNRTSLLQLGKTMAQNISHFWKSLEDFKRNVSIFAADLKANLEQGRVFESIADVTTDIRAYVDTQNYWEAVENLHHEYDAWHTQGDSALPPPSFVAAAKEVATVLSEEKGLVADPIDLISLKISANVNDQGSRTASNEHELANMSSNGLSYIILCVVLIGFVNRIRRKEPVVVPFVVDELKDLSYVNAKTLLDLLTRNNIVMISAFPDVDLDLAELFERNYKILPGRKVGLIDLEKEESEDDIEEEVSNV